MEQLNSLFTAAEISRRVEEIGRQITQIFRDEPFCLISVLNGGLMFTADLIRHLPLTMKLDFIKVSSYEGDRSTGNPKCMHFPSMELQGEHVLIVDDILDTGQTLQHICHLVESYHPASVRTCVFLDKPSRRTVDFKPDYVGFEIEDAFVVGYGMDYDGRYRNLPYVAVLIF